MERRNVNLILEAYKVNVEGCYGRMEKFVRMYGTCRGE